MAAERRLSKRRDHSVQAKKIEVPWAGRRFWQNEAKKLNLFIGP
jgi:hypothetical protein